MIKFNNKIEFISEIGINHNGSIITAKKQRRGRGTRGKKWFSKKNNLFISIYFELNYKNLKIDQFALFNPHIIKSIL